MYENFSLLHFMACMPKRRCKCSLRRSVKDLEFTSVVLTEQVQLSCKCNTFPERCLLRVWFLENVAVNVYSTATTGVQNSPHACNICSDSGGLVCTDMLEWCFLVPQYSSSYHVALRMQRILFASPAITFFFPVSTMNVYIWVSIQHSKIRQ